MNEEKLTKNHESKRKQKVPWINLYLIKKCLNLHK